MTPGLTSIIIPTYNHAEYLRDAIDSALAQTALVEVLVIDDGSTDGTADLMLELTAGDFSDSRLRWLPMRHAGPSAARNHGIELASGEFIVFLDADDVLARDKVERQMLAMTSGIGWVLCDVLIEKLGGGITTASERYHYAAKDLGGWVQPLLVAGNFIPIMSPLVRRDVIGDAIRFTDRTPEDWHFWYAIAGVARVAYVDEILATYRKRAGGRNATVRPHPAGRPGVRPPVRLNLGCGTPDTRSWHPIPGLVNLDRALGWRFEDGLGDFVDGSVAGITISHALMYVALSDWPRVFAEFARVLEPGGILRITEDDAVSPSSSRLGGWRGSQPAVTLTDAAMVRRHMEAVGFTAFDVRADTSWFRDLSLVQAQHGAPPDVFFIEGRRECSVLLSPHADDETLFAAFTVIRHRPRVVICCPSAGDYGDTDTRTAESREAVAILGGGPVEQWDGTALVAKFRELDGRIRPTRVWAPSSLASHPDHVAVAHAARTVFGDRLVRFHTYDSSGRVRAGEPVPFEPGWVELKRQALACYRTQLLHPRARAFFDWDLAEYRE